MGKEQREFERAELNFPVQYRSAGTLAALWQHGTLVNISAAGLRLATREPLEFETKVECEIVLPIRNNPYMLIGVIASEHERLGQYEYGVAFVDVAPGKGAEIDEMVRFLNQTNES